MTRYRLFGYEGSGSAAVEAALTLAGEPFDTVAAASWDEASALEELARVNPLQQIPTLVFPDGSVMSESAAILIELGLRHPASGLLPADPKARTAALRGLVYIAANCYAAIGVIDYPERYSQPCSKPAAKAIRAGTRARLHELWGRFADQHPASPYLGGASPGALDLLAFTVSRWSGASAWLHEHRSDWAAVLGRIERHAAIAGVFARHFPPSTRP